MGKPVKVMDGEAVGTLAGLAEGLLRFIDLHVPGRFLLLNLRCILVSHLNWSVQFVESLGL
jgi:hypothetical protein